MLTETRAYTLGPENATLTVRTRKGGAAAKAGHNLVIEVTSWHGTLDLGDGPTITLTADAHSLRVREGSGGVKRLDADDMVNIDQTIDEEVLKGTTIAFRSTRVTHIDNGLDVEGELELAGRAHALTFTLEVADGHLTGTATVKQTDFGIEPYSAMFGTLKVLDEVEVVVDTMLPAA